MKFKTLLLAAAMMAFSTAASANLVIDLEGQESNGAGPNIFSINNADTAEVINVTFDFTYDAGVSGQNVSWGSELVVEVAHLPTSQFAQIGTQAGGCNDFGITCEFDLMWDQTPGIFTASGSITFAPIADGSGDWQITIADSFDDGGVAADGVFLAGSNITVNQVVPAQVPVPGTLLLIGIGLAGMGIARRRSA